MKYVTLDYAGIYSELEARLTKINSLIYIVRGVRRASIECLTGPRTAWVGQRAKPKSWFGNHFGELFGPLGEECQVHYEMELWLSDNPKYSTVEFRLRDNCDKALLKVATDFFDEKGIEITIKSIKY